MHRWTFPVYVVVHKNIKNFVKYNKQFEIDGIYTASLSPTSYIPVPNVTLLRQYLTLLAFDRFHLLDIQLSISGAILTKYR